jgi:site-specific DNA recombinase
MAEAAEFDILAVREVDRLSRNLAKQLIVEEKLRRHGVQVEYALADYPDTPEGRLQKHVRATIAEYEREKIAERIVRGRRLKVKSGHVLVHGRPPFGYRVGDAEGKTTLVVHEAEAEVVRLMFRWYIEGDEESGPLSLGAIADKLEELILPLPSGGKPRWHRTTVHYMLQNETYDGTWHYGKQSKQPGEPIPVEVPAIVSRETWKAAQARRSENGRNAVRNTKREYLLRRRITCGGCGLKVSSASRVTGGKLYKYYRCPAHYGGRHEYTRVCH